MNVLISPNIKKEAARIDLAGNKIDPRTKQVIEANVPDYVPTQEEINNLHNRPVAPQTAPQPQVTQTVWSEASPKQIQAEIETLEKRMEELNALKKARIEALKKELEELE